MIRRDFCKTSLALAGLALRSERLDASASPAEEFPKAPGLTKFVSEFIVNAKYEDIPENVLTLGKKTILDGFGLSLAGSASVIGPRLRQYNETHGWFSRNRQHHWNKNEGPSAVRGACQRHFHPCR